MAALLMNIKFIWDIVQFWIRKLCTYTHINKYHTSIYKVVVFTSSRYLSL